MPVVFIVIAVAGNSGPIFAICSELYVDSMDITTNVLHTFRHIVFVQCVHIVLSCSQNRQTQQKLSRNSKSIFDVQYSTRNQREVRAHTLHVCLGRGIGARKNKI